MDSNVPRVTFRKKLGYGLGHVLNDLCASMWFTYLLLFYHKVLEFDNNYAGVVLLVGQVADGLSTTIVGFLSDKPATLWLCARYGRRKAWHLIGTFCVLISFPFVFLPCEGCFTAAGWVKLVYYCSFAVMFQFGWASVQISHLALIPAITSSQNERTGLTAIRYGMTVISNITVYLVAWAFFGMGESAGEVTSADLDKFRNIMLVVIGMGSVTSLIFHLSVKEEVCDRKEGEGENRGGSIQTDLVVPMTVKSWFLEPQFYQVAGVYMSTRLFVNLSQAYMPLYLIESLQLQSTYIAIIPLVMFVAGFVMSFFMKPLNRLAGRKLTYLLGSAVGVGASVFVYYGSDCSPTYMKYGIFVVASMFGVASSTLLITSLSLTAELIAQNTESSAFVYGAMSFTDKVSNGVGVMVIQHFIPCFKYCEGVEESNWYYRDVLFFACGAAALLGAFFVLTLGPTTVGKRRRDHKGVDEVADERTPLLISELAFSKIL